MRTYGKIKDTASTFDIELLRSLEKFQQENSDEIAKRKCDAYLLTVDPVVYPDSPRKKEPVGVCQSTYKNGSRCTAKSKPNESFCGRHLKK